MDETPNTLDDSTSRGQAELLPCPFCGGVNAQLIIPHGGEPVHWSVICAPSEESPGCGASGTWELEKAVAINRWNKRAPLSDDVKAVKKTETLGNETPPAQAGNTHGGQMALASWQPIESAPRDGSDIIGAAFHPNVGLLGIDLYSWGSWTEESGQRCWGWKYESGHLDPDEPTHWLPLPDAPSVLERNENQPAAPVTPKSEEELENEVPLAQEQSTVPGQMALLGGINALIQPDYHALNVHDGRNDRLLHATLCAYAKWHLDNPDIGSEQLSTILSDAICESIGDASFVEWVNTIKGE